MNLLPFVIIFLLAAMLASISNAEHWSSSNDIDSSHWSIYRESSNMVFNLSSSVEGSISPVESHGRTLAPYQSYYEEIRDNDVQLRQRINSLKGIYKSTDDINLLSVVYPGSLEVLIDMPAGTDVHTIEYDETWPVLLKAERTLTYFGKQINNYDFESNNGDSVAANLLYNNELSKEQRSNIWLQQMNATVLATNKSIILAEFKPTKYLGYLISTKTTGIADLSYKFRDSQYDVKHQNYLPPLGEGDERYYGAFDLTRKIEMRSLFKKANTTDDEDSWMPSWLPCCSDGWDDRKLQGANSGLQAGVSP